MTKQELAKKMENRVFDVDVRAAEVSSACYEAILYGFPSVQVFPVMVEECREILRETGVKIAVLIDYPHGGFPISLKVFEIEDAKKRGAEIFNVCITTRNVKDQKWDMVDKELRALRQAAGMLELRIFLETEYLTDDEIRELCSYAIQNKVDTLITSTGLYYKLDNNLRTEVPLKADVNEIRFVKSLVGEKVKVMAQGFIDDYTFAMNILDAGADFIGTINSVKILKGLKQ